jgi:hypothetical protein
MVRAADGRSTTDGIPAAGKLLAGEVPCRAGVIAGYILTFIILGTGKVAGKFDYYHSRDGEVAGGVCLTFRL